MRQSPFSPTRGKRTAELREREREWEKEREREKDHLLDVDEKKNKPDRTHSEQSPLAPWAILMISGLCVMFFLLGNQLCENTLLGNREGGRYTVLVGSGTGNLKIEPCDLKLQDYTPCMDPLRWSKFPQDRLQYLERHCPAPLERMHCLIPPPMGYMRPVPWPQSRDECWYNNVPYEFLSVEKADQHWVQRDGDKFTFQGGGSTFPEGVGAYLDQMQTLIPGMANGTVRTVLDTGCGVASFGGYLLERNILTMSIAPRDDMQAQVAFALERGIPAMLGALATRRLPYPARSFDLVHCSSCSIPWTSFGGIYLMEVNRILRPGGFWVLSGPPINYQERWQEWNSTLDKQKAELAVLQGVLSRLCFQLLAMRGDLAVWQKPLNNECYLKRPATMQPPICDDGIDPDTAWYTTLTPCIDLLPPSPPLPPWPKRVATLPDRLNSLGQDTSATREAVKQDWLAWADRTKQYRGLVPEAWRPGAGGGGHVRNVLDMNAEYGGFAAALKKLPVWVMNVVPVTAANTLGVIYDRGFVGAYHDWCQAFDTYPRSYDFVHAYHLLSAHTFTCEIGDILLEVDRILRPKGVFLVKDTGSLLELVSSIAPNLHWQCHHHPGFQVGGGTSGDGGTAGDTEGEDMLLCRKQFWRLTKKGRR